MKQLSHMPQYKKTLHKQAHENRTTQPKNTHARTQNPPHSQPIHVPVSQPRTNLFIQLNRRVSVNWCPHRPNCPVSAFVQSCHQNGTPGRPQSHMWAYWGVKERWGTAPKPVDTTERCQPCVPKALHCNSGEVLRLNIRTNVGNWGHVMVSGD